MRDHLTKISQYLNSASAVADIDRKIQTPTIIKLSIDHSAISQSPIVPVLPNATLPGTIPYPYTTLFFPRPVALVSLNLEIQSPVAVQAVLGASESWLVRIEKSGDVGGRAPLGTFDSLNIFSASGVILLRVEIGVTETPRGAFVVVNKGLQISSIFTDAAPSQVPFYDLNYVIENRLTWKKQVEISRSLKSDFEDFVKSLQIQAVRKEIDGAISRAEISRNLDFEISRSSLLMTHLMAPRSPAPADPWVAGALERLRDLEIPNRRKVSPEQVLLELARLIEP